MINKLTVAFFSVILIINCSTPDKKIEMTDFTMVLPDTLNGFARTDRVKVYPADSLYSYIDGAAEEYLGYGVVQVASCEYIMNELTFSVDIFEFASLLGAFGVYSRHRLSSDNFINLGTEALLGSSYIYYLKDRFFMTLNSYGDNLPDFESMNSFAAAIDSLLPGTALYPRQIMVFPQKRLIMHSEKFWPHGFEKFAAPESCFSADYKKRNDTCTLFYSLNRDESEYETFKKVIQQRGRILSHTAGVGKNSIYSVSEQDGRILLGYSDRVIFGVLEVSGDYWAKALCEALFDNLGLKL